MTAPTTFSLSSLLKFKRRGHGTDRRTVCSSHSHISPEKAKRVAIVGGGPGGMACARECLREGLHVTVFERSKGIGGTWLVDDLNTELQTLNILSDEGRKKAVDVHSSMYDGLRVNIPRELMGYTDYPFDSNFPGSRDPRRYCGHAEVKRYLEAFVHAFHLDEVTEFNTMVVGIEKAPSTEGEWAVEVQSDDGREVRTFDAVVVANGHFSVPYIPDVQDLDRFEKPCLHSHLYRNAKPFTDKRVVILGNSYSGKDIAHEISEVAEGVYLCGRDWKEGIKELSPLGTRKNLHHLSNIDHCSGPGRITLQDGEVLEDVDALIFCTGYLFDFSFLTDKDLNPLKDRMIYPLYLGVFHARHPTLCFLGIHSLIVPFLVSEYQSKYISRVLSGRCGLPEEEGMINEIDRKLEALRKTGGSLESFHNLGDAQFAYMNALAAKCPDVKSLSEWRLNIWAYDKVLKAASYENFRDLERYDDCIRRAHLEFSEVRKLTHERELMKFAPAK